MKRRLTLTLIVLLAGVARAHNGEPMPMPPSKPPVDLRNVKQLPRWSWLHWWEANREPYLVSMRQTESLQPAGAGGAAQVAALRAEASPLLIKAIEQTTRDALRIEAALALGKMRHAPALATLTAMAARAEKPAERRAALVAVGLIGSPEAEKALVASEAPRPEDQVAALAAVGLLPKIESTTLRQLRTKVTRDAPGARDQRESSAQKVGTSSVVTWSLRHHRQDDNLLYFRTLLRNSMSPWVASEALLGLGGTRDREAQRVLEETLFGSALQDVRAYDNLELELRAKMQAAAGAAAGGRRPRGRDEDIGKDPDEETGALFAEPEHIAMGWLRSSAAIALGQLEAPRAGTALLRFLDEDVVKQPHLVTPQSFAIMSLAAYPTEASRDKLIALLGRPEQGGRLRTDVDRNSPLRGFAALALGLYARPHDTPQGPGDRPGFESAINTLGQRLDDDRETEEVRTACAVGLGLTKRTEVLPILLRATARLQERNRRTDVAVFGFVLLGRALAGDANVIEPAARMLQTSDDDTSPAGILSRRAAVLALGLTGNAAAVPVLTKAWHLNYHVNREVILAMRLVGAANAAGPVMERLRQSKDDEERAYMAQALGELLAVERPATLSRLTAGNNYTVRNEFLLPLQALANRFLYDYLIASFGEQW